MAGRLSGGTVVEKEIVNYISFNKEIHMTLGDGDGMENSPKQINIKPKITTSYKQLKFLISKIQFLNHYWNSDISSPTLICIYEKLENDKKNNLDIISQLYPQFEMLFYTVGEFTDSLIKELSLKNNIYFISEIDDMDQQKNWVSKLKPYKSLLMFKLPTKDQTYSYFNGLLYLPCWTLAKSTDAFLVPTDGLRNWNVKMYYDLMYFFLLERQNVNYYNVITSTKGPISPELGLMNEFDSSLTTVIIMDFLIVHSLEPSEENVKAIFKKFIKELSDTENEYDLVNLRNKK